MAKTLRYGVTLTGIHPRSEELVKLTRALELGTERVKESDLERSFREDTLRVISFQEENGFRYVLDPCLRWKDHFRPLTALGGIEVGAGYSRWFTTNTFYKKPMVKGELRAKGRAIKNLFFTDLLPRENGGVILAGPYTFAKLSEDKHYGDHGRLMKAYASFIAKIIAVSSKRIQYVQLSEPALVSEETKPTKGELEKAAEGYRSFANVLKGKVRVSLHTYFGSCAGIFDFVSKLPFHYTGIDFVRTRISELKKQRMTKALICGFIDAESSYVESVEEVTEFVKEVREVLSPPEILVAPNMDLRYLPRSVAELKLKNMIEAVKILRSK